VRRLDLIGVASFDSSEITISINYNGVSDAYCIYYHDVAWRVKLGFPRYIISIIGNASYCYYRLSVIVFA